MMSKLNKNCYLIMSDNDLIHLKGSLSTCKNILHYSSLKLFIFTSKRQTVETLIRCCRMWCLRRVSTVCKSFSHFSPEISKLHSPTYLNEIGLFQYIVWVCLFSLKWVKEFVKNGSTCIFWKKSFNTIHVFTIFSLNTGTPKLLVYLHLNVNTAT